MRDRKKILQDLIWLRGSVEELTEELSEYPWDLETPLVIISIDALVHVLKRGLSDELTVETLTSWANAVECRDDIDFVCDEIQEVVHLLANPEINGDVTRQLLNDIVIKLNALRQG